MKFQIEVIQLSDDIGTTSKEMKIEERTGPSWFRGCRQLHQNQAATKFQRDTRN